MNNSIGLMKRLACAITCAVAMAILVPSAQAQQYQRLYSAPGSGNDERAVWVETTPDGGSILVGVTSLGNFDIWLMKTDSLGVMQWERRIGAPGAVEVAHGVIPTSDGGYLIYAQSTQFSQSMLRLVVKTDNLGMVQWSRMLQGATSGNAGGPGLAEVFANDGSSMGYVIGGEVYGSHIGLPALWKAPVLSRLSTTGALLWTRYYIDTRYGMNTNGTFTDVHALPGGNIVATGYTAEGLGKRDTLLMEVNSAGVPVWAKTYSSGLHNDWAYGMDRAPNNDYVLTGFNKEIGEGGGSFLLRTDPSGTLLWYRTFQSFSPSTGLRCTPADDIVLLGYNAPGSNEVALLKTNGSGTFQWAMAYGGGSSELAGGLALRPGGGYTLFCSTASFGVDPFDWWLIGTDAIGRSLCNEFPYVPNLPTIVPVVEDVIFDSLTLPKMAAVSPPESAVYPLMSTLCDSGAEGACCYMQQGSWHCTVTTLALCENVFHGVYFGDGTPCTANLCNPPQIGACCWMNAAGIWDCVVTSQARCEDNLGGTYLGNGTACTPDLCDPPKYGACCYFQQGYWHCTITTAEHCEVMLGGVYQGDSTTCTPNPCPQNTGACCLSNGTCVVTIILECELAGGTFQGVGTNCTPNPCPQPKPGACCYLAAQGVIQCTITTQFDCEVNLGGWYQGDGTNCTPDPCVRGACCYQVAGAPFWHCVMVTEADCVNNYFNGTFQGPGSTCTPNPCPPPATGACCRQTSQGSICFITIELECEMVGGTYLGDNVPCTPNPCATGACCTPQLGCVQVSLAECESLGGVYLGNNVPCMPNPCALSNGCATPPHGMVLWLPFDEIAPSVAHEIAAGNHGTHMGVTTIIVGVVNYALYFNGSSSYVNVPNAPQINLGTGDLTIDAWIIGYAPGIQPIVDKRQGPIGSTVGYTMFLYNGQLAFQLADGAGHTNYLSGVNIANGYWRHVAVTVQRNNPTGGRFYVDGVHVATFNPMGRMGSLNNNAPLWVGRRHPINSILHYSGMVDELEIFRRALTAAEIHAIYKAGQLGKCKMTCHAPWDHPFCKNQNKVTVPITVCNNTPTASPFQLSFTGLPVGPGCHIAGPTSFTVSGPNPVTIPPYSCVTVNVSIQRPAGMNAAFLAGCYEVTIQNMTTGATTTCQGSVQDRRDLCGVIVWPPVDIVSVPVGVPQTITFDVTNTTDDPITTPIRIVAYDPAMQPSMDISINGLAPGEPWGRVVTIPPGLVTPVSISLEAMFVEHEGLRFSDIVLYTDVDGDGEYEPLHSVGLRSIARPACPADLNGSGNVDVQDLLILLGAWGPCPKSDVCLADLNYSGAVDVQDLLILLGAWGPCP
ncbi:MAG TPA: hypothetical protein PK098_12735 [Phycisphaerales bacterium]|nr:hypothetical protein [Phycisphaerales bacterium]